MATTEETPNPRVIDLFAGCGGMSLGFQKAGFEVLAAFDNWQPAIDVYNDNFSHKAFVQDLSDVEASISAIEGFAPEVIIGGPPCQDFSTAGQMNENGGRATLSIKFAEIITSLMPKWFVMENVANVQRTQTFAKTIEVFKNSGYGITKVVLDASLCGVPQTRKRMFVVGGLGEPENFLTSALENALSPKPLTIREYLGDSLGIDHYFRVPTNYSRRGVFSIDEPSMTIRGVERPIPPGYKGHPQDSAPVGEVRALTIEERGRLQTFPEGFQFNGTKSALNQMIGNAVPVNLAKFVARQLHAYAADRVLSVA